MRKKYGKSSSFSVPAHAKIAVAMFIAILAACTSNDLDTIATAVLPSTTVMPTSETPIVSPSPHPTDKELVVSTPFTTREPEFVLTTASTSTPVVVPPLALTPIPVHVADDRFGVIDSGPGRDWRVQSLGVQWLIDFDSDPANRPPGVRKVPFIQVSPTLGRLSPERLVELTASSPGSVWYIGGEPNVIQQGNMSPEAFVSEFDYYSTAIRTADPTALITSPSILNWDFTCSDCGGFTSGEVWMRGFIDAYAAAHGGRTPDVDIWTIDTYPLTWDSVPMTDWQIVRDQLLGFRNFLSSEVPGHAESPIWVTEIASHWGYDAWVIQDGLLTIPSEQDYLADFLWDDIAGYMNGILGWLQANGSDLNIERWFFFKGYVDLQAPKLDGYAGVHFFSDDSSSAQPNQLGKLYREYATGMRR